MPPDSPDLSITLETAASDEIARLIGELEAELSAEYPPDQRHGLALSAIFQPHIRFFVARGGGMALGCGGVALFDDFAEVKRMYVRPAARGRGVARALLARIEQEVVAAGFGELRLETGNKQHAAMRMYERIGFQRCGPFGAYATMADDAVATSIFYRKPLGGTPLLAAAGAAAQHRPMDDRILIWGAGAIGGTVGTYLSRAGHDVTFVDIEAGHVAAMRDPAAGLRIIGPVEQFTTVVPSFVPEEVTGTWDRIFLAVKAHHTADACRALAPHLAADGYVLSLQNGLCETIIGEIVGRERTVGAFVNFGADWMGPGEIMFGNRGAVVLGELDGSMTPRLAALHRLLRDFEPDAIMTTDIWSYLWGKLGYGAMLFAQALGNLGIADCLARPELLPVWQSLGREAVEVAVAEGVQPRGFNGFDPAAFGPGSTDAAAAASVAAMVAFNRPSAKTHSGVWRDLAVRHRRTEVDVQIAPIAEIGARHGLPCPTVRKLVALIHEAEQGRPLSDDTLLELLP